jgi:hypothetical protein
MVSKSRIGRIIAVFLFLAAVSLITKTVDAVASCWGSNPDGNRTCQEFVSKGGLHLRLCEDQAGDCERAGYALAVQSQGQAETAQTDETEIGSPSKPRRRRYSQASDGSTEKWSQQDDNLLIFIGVVVLVFIFGGTYTRGAIAGLVIGLFGGSELNLLEVGALNALHEVSNAERQNEKLYAEREALFARMNEYAMKGLDRATGLSGMEAHKRLKKDRADWERRARKAGWNTT